MHEKEPQVDPFPPRTGVQRLPVGLAAVYAPIGLSLILGLPESVGVDFIHRYPWVASRWMHAVPMGLALLALAWALLSYRKVGWWAALTLSVLVAALHPYQLVLGIASVPYLLSRDVRSAYGVSAGDASRVRVANILGCFTFGLLLLLGCFHLVAMPNMIGAHDRGKQKRTMGDVRTIATAVESYSLDHGAYPRRAGNVEVLQPFLEPTYVKVLPTEDAWGTPFWFVRGPESPHGYRIVSFGDGGVASGPRSGATTSYSDDIIFATGSFVTYPDGPQR